MALVNASKARVTSPGVLTIQKPEFLSAQFKRSGAWIVNQLET